MRIAARLVLALIGGALLAAPGCRHGAPTAPAAPSATLQNLWPNDDGRFWTYRIVKRRWDVERPAIFPTPGEVPAAPSLDEIEVLLRGHPIGANPDSEIASFKLQFDGMFTTLSGATGQNLTETVLRPGVFVPAAASGPSAFLASLARARPDLRPRLATLAPAPDEASALIGRHPALFLFGYAWKRTAEWIGSYGDVDTLLAWEYLAADLAPGDEFSVRLVPSLAADVYLHARILPRRIVTTPAGSFAGAVECLYEVDYGLGAEVDISGNIVGFSRYFSYGTVAYARDVGPVASYDRVLVSVGDPESRGFEETKLGLTATGPLAVAREPSWEGSPAPIATRISPLGAARPQR